ncbi:hypothetical protein [Paenibacillus agricola]|uniref:Uncharacterized protein n=1 Tax=Paenibacillus agricola TaxID=2716264 RepID=A0ABX0J7M8_9BACL|nr:hypothetical protein [Paenibacillus agricola]NHN31623.1 hypothetical protein [Paenibacillus agricola]
MKDIIQSNLKDLIDYVNGKKKISERATLIASLTVTAFAIAVPNLGTAASTAFTLMGVGIPVSIKKVLKSLDRSSTEDRAVEVFERCRFTDFVLSRMAVAQAVEKNLTGEDRFFARWKLAKTVEEHQKEILKNDEEREEKYIQGYQDNQELNHEAYWDQLLAAILKVMDIKAEEESEFRTMMKQEIGSMYQSLKNLVIFESEFFKLYITSTVTPNQMMYKLNQLAEFVNSHGNLYKTIDQMEQWLKSNTEPSISLNFFDYDDKEFAERVIEQFADESKDVIYVKGKTREETMFYLLYIIKNLEKHHKQDTLVVETLENWNSLKENCQGKVLIPNFHASVIDTIPGNRNIIIYGDENYIGHKNPIELKKRKLANMHEKLREEKVDLETVNRFVLRTNGLYASFKRIVFKGKTGEPEWEEKKNSSLIPALLAGMWSESEGDMQVMSKLTSDDYNKLIRMLNPIIDSEDPFLISFIDYGSSTFRLANVEEAWEVLFEEITFQQLETFREIVIEVLTEVSPEYKLPIEDHYKAAVLDKVLKYSRILKKGIARSLIMLANMSAVNYSLKQFFPQKFVDEIVSEILNQADTKIKWIALSEYFPDLVEAAPEVTMAVVERETSDSGSPFWILFEQNGDGLWARNYYTHILWALEKLLCFEETAPGAVRILTKLSERKIVYAISNSPLSTLDQALSAWRHEINLSMDEKIRLTRIVVTNSEIGWDLLERLLPDRSPSRVYTDICKPDYRRFEFKYLLRNKQDILRTLREYTLFAVDEARVDLSKWGLLFKKFFFFELGLADEVITGVQKAIKMCGSDEAKYDLKEIIRGLLHQHRFFRDAKWAADEEYLMRIEKEVFVVVSFDNHIYEFLHLFTSDQPNLIHPIPYRERERDYREERVRLRESRSIALSKIVNDPEMGLVKLLSKLTDAHALGLYDIGSIMASDFHEYQSDDEFVKLMLQLNQIKILYSYIGTIYQHNGLKVIKDFLGTFEANDELLAGILRIAKIDEAFLKLIDSCESSVIETYWKGLSMIGEIEDLTVREHVWDRLLNSRNYAPTLDMLHRYYGTDVYKHLQLLENIRDDFDEYKISQHEEYLIVKSFERLYKADQLSEKNSSRVTRLEWAFFNLLINQATPRYLERELKSDPELLTQLIQFAFKSSDQVDSRVSLNEQQLQMAKQSLNILMKVKFCPCMDDKGNISLNELKNWTQKYLQLIDQNKQEVIGRQILGECFAYSPPGEDGGFPHEAVRQVFEEHYSDHLKAGFEIGIFNSRGVYTVTGGEEEGQLAERYGNYARTVRIDYPQLSKTLKEISDRYMSDSEVERERASHDI